MGYLHENPSSEAVPAPARGALALAAGLMLAQGCALTTLQTRLGESGALPSDRTATGERGLGADGMKHSAGKSALNGAMTGTASWYGPGLNGKRTATGEVFDDDKLTAAHKTLPLGSKAKVTNLKNGRSVNVEINDRGPFSGNRIIDLSRAAAHAIGMVNDGVTQVRIEPVGPQVVAAGGSN